MPTFTVVPVEDVEDGSNSGAAAGGNRPISLGKIFSEEQEADSAEDPFSGRCKQFFADVLIHKPSFWGFCGCYPSMHCGKYRCAILINCMRHCEIKYDIGSALTQTDACFDRHMLNTYRHPQGKMQSQR